MTRGSVPAGTDPPAPGGPSGIAGLPGSYRSARFATLAALWILLPAGIWLAEFGPAKWSQPLVLRGLGAAICGWSYVSLAVMLARWPAGMRPPRSLFAADAAGLAAAAALFAAGHGVPGFALLAAAGVTGLSLRIARLGRLELVGVTTAILHIAAGAAFLALLGPGIAQVGSPAARAALGAVLILFAWIGWSLFHPVTRRIPLQIILRAL